MAEYQTISVTRDGAVATLSLNRPDVRNAMNPEMIGEITAAFAEFNALEDIRAVVIAEAQTKFCISEVRIGLVPGIIAAFILPRTGPGWFRYLSKTAVLFDTETARSAGLIHEIAADDDDLEARIAAHATHALDASPDAIADTGHLIDALGYGINEENLDKGLLFNAKARLSDAAQEGISAFLEKRSPAWKPAE